MKNYLILGCLLCSMAASAQKIDQSKVPGPVKAALAKSFPTAGSVKWELEKSNYEAGFKDKNMHISALYDAKGNWLETETGITLAQLPEEATAYVTAHYKGAKIKEAAKIQKANGDINYEAEVNGRDVIFDSKGGFLKEEKE